MASSRTANMPMVEVELDELGRPARVLVNGVSVPGVLDVSAGFKAGLPYRPIEIRLAARQFEVRQPM